MGQNSKGVLLVTENSFLLKLVGSKAESLIECPRPVLWNNNGMYCWINCAKVRNAVTHAHDVKLAAESNSQSFTPKLMFNWDTGMSRHSHKEMAATIENLVGLNQN